MPTSSIGVIGLAVMGSNLARNFANRDLHTSVYNRSYEKTEQLMQNHGTEYLHGFEKLEEFIDSLEKPRRVLLMVQAGAAVDAVLAQKDDPEGKKTAMQARASEESSSTDLKRSELAKKDFLVDKILDKAGQKGTGALTVIDAAIRGIAVPSIAEAVFARSLSAQKELRIKL